MERAFRIGKKVFEHGLYSIMIGEPGTKNMKKFDAIKTLSHEQEKEIMVDFSL